MFGFNFQDDLAANAEAMTATSTQVITAEITTAVRDATVDGVVVKSGQTIGLVDGDLVVADESPTAVYAHLVGALDLANRELVTIYYGRETVRADAEALASYLQAQAPDLAAVEVQHGGQALYDYIIAAE